MPLFGVNYMTAMIISAIVIVGYTAAGGFLAASTTDFIQSIIMTFAILFVLVFATVSAGGVGVVLDNAKALPGYLSFSHTYVAAEGAAAPYGFLKIVAEVKKWEGHPSEIINNMIENLRELSEKGIKAMD